MEKKPDSPFSHINCVIHATNGVCVWVCVGRNAVQCTVAGTSKPDMGGMRRLPGSRDG